MSNVIITQIYDLSKVEILHIYSGIDECVTISIVYKKEQIVRSIGFQEVSISTNFKDLNTYFKNIGSTTIQKGIYEISSNQKKLLPLFFKAKKTTYLIYTGIAFHLVTAKSHEMSMKMDINKLPGNYYSKCVKDGNDNAFKNSDYPM